MTAPLQPPILSANLWDYVTEMRPQVERALRLHLPVAPSQFKTPYNEALQYALFPGGKRLRPILTLLGAELVGGRADDVMAAAAAVEFIHTSSLVFDDLPCMDDARQRRGHASLHLRYGEAVAILVGLALLNASYGIVMQITTASPERVKRTHNEIVECVGPLGMVTGQSIDLVGASPLVVEGEFDAARNLKTSALMRLSLSVGAILCGATQRQLAALARVADLLGNAYQIRDDLHDLQEDGGQRALLNSGAAGEADHAASRSRIAAQVAEVKDLLAREFGESRAVSLLCEVADFIAQSKG